ncbi:Mu-like prophage tail sheath protein gpL [Rodentibacter pneumotropicus]|uniref:Mu-like prophage tail sheath protein gpL n=2 Tax=Rodentibacter pneumotropicus TaxID=758 RepID=A0A448MPS4_9PAST|nr:Mu-like prophage tail sheath protein gpL [Rodentibacter pneumotropicus]
MARVAIQNNAMIRLTAIGLKDNEAGVAATGSIALSGTATTAGVLK